MTKKIQIYVLATLCLLALIGCKKEAETGYENHDSLIEIISAETNFPSAGTKEDEPALIVFKLDPSLKEKPDVKSSKSWVKIIGNADGVVTFGVDRCTSPLDRSANIIIAAGKASRTITILQSGMTYSFDFTGTSTLMLDPVGKQAKELTYDIRGGKPEIGEHPQWLAIEINEEEAVITFMAALNLSAERRSASIELTQGWKKGVVYVEQVAASVFNHESFGCDAAGCSMSDNIGLADDLKRVLSSWRITRTGDWFTVTPEKESFGPEETFAISIPENGTGKTRRGSVNVYDMSDGGEGVLIYTLPVLQTNFTYETLPGTYELSGGDADPLIWDFKKSEGSDRELSVKIMNTEGAQKTDGYRLSLTYVASGDRSPRMELSLPQDCGTVGAYKRVLYPIKPSGYSENFTDVDGTAPFLCYYLSFSGSGSEVMFDFVTAPQAYTYMWTDGSSVCPEGFTGIYLEPYDWIVPATTNNSLHILKWGSGNHEGFDRIN